MKVVLDERSQLKPSSDMKTLAGETQERPERSTDKRKDRKDRSNLVVIQQDYKNGHITRNKDATDVTDLPSSNIGEKRSSCLPKSLFDKRFVETVKEGGDAPKAEIDDPCELVFKKSSKDAAPQRATVIRTKTRRPAVNFKYVDIRSGENQKTMRKPSFKIKKPPTLVEKSLDQESLMGHFSSKNET